MSRCLVFVSLLTVVCGAAFGQTVKPGDLQVLPASIVLTHARRPHSILVATVAENGLSRDLTSQATYKSGDESIAKVDLLGWVHPVATGRTTILVTAAGQTATVAVEVKLPETPTPYSFRHDVMPVLSKAGCNMGACHGYSLGKNGFKLSLRGSDPAPDYLSLTDEFFERRVNRHNPPASLVLTKPLGDVPHQGGIRFDRDSLLHELLLGWIAEGPASDVADPVEIESLRIHPANVVLSPGGEHQLQLLARYSDGSERDVTRLGIFNANTESVATVDDVGLVSAVELGETAVVARFERIFATVNFIVLKPNPKFQPTPVPTDNPIDAQVVRKLNDLHIEPSPLADDAQFLRRVYLDLIGVQPKPAEVLAFVADTDSQKRTRVVDELFLRPEFVDWWSLKWGDLLQNSRNRLSEPAMFAFREWIRGAVASNMPLDEFARTILTGRGGLEEDPTAAYFAVSKDTEDTLERATQVFCGVRMLCAKCHPHPFENWTQADYYGLASFFNQVSTKADPRFTNVKNANAVLVKLDTGYARNPRSGQPQPPRYLGGDEPKVESGLDRRVDYARWLTSSDNPHFARSLANRIWSYFFHRGIIEPVDDIRTTNPPSNAGLLDALTAELVQQRFDVRQLMRRIVLSQTYQRSSVSNGSNAHDELNFSRAIPRRLAAEALLDCLVQATSVPEAIGGAPAGFSAAQLPDANVQSDFLSLFGKPSRAEACECERDGGSNMLQALNMINGKSILSRVSAPNSRLAQLLKQKLSDEQLIEELHLWSLARKPTEKETAIALEFLQSYGDQKTEAAQDLMWALLNSRDFMLVQ